MAPPKAPSIEILGDRFCIYSQPLEKGLHIGPRDDGSVFLSIEKQFGKSFWDPLFQEYDRNSWIKYENWNRGGTLSDRDGIDPDLVVLSLGYNARVSRKNYAKIVLTVFHSICLGKVMCHEIKHGKRESISFRSKDGKIDPRIQQFIDIRDTKPPLLAGPRPLPGDIIRQPFYGPAKERSEIADAPPQSKKKADTTLHSCRDQIDSTERDKDDEEPVKTEDSVEEMRMKVSQEATTRDKSAAESQPTPGHTKTRSREIAEMGSDSDLDQPPHKRRQRRGLTSQPPTPVSSMEKTSARPHANSENADSVDNHTNTTTSAQAQRQAEPDIVREEKIARAPTVPPEANDKSDRLAIKKLKLNIKELQFKVDFDGDEDQLRQRRLIDIAKSKLEIAEMEYEMQYGKEYRD